MDVWLIADDDNGNPGHVHVAYATRRAALERLKRDEWQDRDRLVHRQKSRRWINSWRFTWPVGSRHGITLRAAWLIKMEVEE